MGGTFSSGNTTNVYVSGWDYGAIPETPVEWKNENALAWLNRRVEEMRVKL